MVFADLLKHQSLSSTCGKFVRAVKTKYNNNITVGEYIIERFIDKNIKVGFGSRNTKYSPFYSVAKNPKIKDDFHIIFHNYEEVSGYSAISHAKSTHELGVIISTSTYGFNNIYNPLRQAYFRHRPIFLMSFYDQENEPKLTTNMYNERRFLKAHQYC